MTPPPTLSPAEQLLLRLSYSLRAAWTAPEAGAYLHDHTPAGRVEAVLVLTAAGVLLPSPADPARLELDPHRRLVAAEAGRCLAVLRGRYQGGELVPLEQAWALWGHAPPLRHQQEALAVLVRAGYLALEPGAVVLHTAGCVAEVRVCNLKLWSLPPHLQARRPDPVPALEVRHDDLA